MNAEEDNIVTFGYIPQLGPGIGTLMPRTGGMAGVEYAQVCTHNLVKGTRSGYVQVKDSEPYVIQGTQGEAQVVLMCKGKPIRNASSAAGAQVCKIDREIYTLTGFEDPDEPKPEDPEDGDKATPAKPVPKEPKESKGPVQARQPSV